MSERVWTAGPWATGGMNQKGRRNIDAGNWSRFAGVFVVTAGEPSLEGEANARLIAAAPELYDALDLLADYFKELAPADQSTESGWASEEHLGVWLAAKAALFKARGTP